MENRTTLKLKRHETFSIREGWIEKGINIIKENSDVFSKDNGPVYFGLGSNMCKSLKYWMTACNVINKDKKTKLSDFGNLLFEYDRYLEDDFSWWFIHLFLSINFDDAPVINAFFNLDNTKFDKETLFILIRNCLEKDNEISSESSLDSDVLITLKSYFSNDESNPEDNLNCPLGKLRLLSQSNNIYEKKAASFNSLDYRVVYYSIYMCYGDYLDHNIEDLYELPNSPLKIFNITKSTLFVYLDLMRKNGFVSISKTAGLNTIHFAKKAKLASLFKSYFEESK